MPKQLAVVILVATGLPALIAGLLAFASPGRVEAVPAFARQYDLQCNACHTRPPRLNRFGEQFHMMGFQIPSAAQPGGIVSSVREDGAVKTIIDSLAIRIEGGLFEYTASPQETETKFAPPDEITLFVARPLLPARSSDNGHGRPDDGGPARWLFDARADADGREGRSEHELLLRDQPPAHRRRSSRSRTGPSSACRLSRMRSPRSSS